MMKGFKTYIITLMSVALLVSTIEAKEQSHCKDSLEFLKSSYESDKEVRATFDEVYRGLHELPVGYSYGGSSQNPWKSVISGKGLHTKMVDMFDAWCEVLPKIDGNADNALDPILYFAWIYYKNQAGQEFVQSGVGAEFLQKWQKEYMSFMNSKESTKEVVEWVNDPLIEIEDYEITDAAKYKSWNEFFARNLKSDKDGNYPSRPVTMPERDYVIVSPTDCIMNPLVQILSLESGGYKRDFVENPIGLNTILDVKNIPISVNDMLGGLKPELKKKFVGGSGLSCVLMPNTYHHFHSPVDGKVLHAEVVETGSKGTPWTFGYPDFPNWAPKSGDVGRVGTDFSQFQAFQRGVIVIEVEYDALGKKKKGYVASIPVGLDSVGSVVLNRCDSKITDRVNCFEVGGDVVKGKTKFGNFYFGGSLNILLFSKGMISPAIQTRMGNQIGVIDMGEAPKSPWSLD
jgi:phosphatidylserine decarboxylase